MSLLLGLGSLAVGAASAAYNAYQQNKANNTNQSVAKQNLAMQREQFEYQKALQNTIFEREDTAVQRRMADNRAAGLSPLAGLTGAEAGSLVPVQAPQLDYNQIAPQIDSSGIQSALGMMQDSAVQDRSLDIQDTTAQANAELTKQKTEAQKLENEYKTATFADRVAGVKYNNESTLATVQKTLESVITEKQMHDINNIRHAQSRAELERYLEESAEWRDNKELRKDLGNLSLEEARERLAALKLSNSFAEAKNPYALDILKQELTAMTNQNEDYESNKEWQRNLDKLGVAGDVMKFLLEAGKSFAPYLFHTKGFAK